jgi:uncharacterized lipoprotein NlpE involved in copper resistance
MKNTALSLTIFTFLFFTSCKSETKNDDIFNDQKEIVNEEQGMDGHTSINAIDWEGIYEGTIPCADCDGIFTELTINNDNTFVMQSTKIIGDKKDKTSQQGLYQWDESGSKITLDINGSKTIYQVEENKLVLLDKDGNKMPESETKNYTLIKKEMKVAK